MKYIVRIGDWMYEHVLTCADLASRRDASADANTVECHDDSGGLSRQHFDAMCVHTQANALRANKVPLYLSALLNLFPSLSMWHSHGMG